MRVNMEQFPISKTDAGLHIEGFPDALKVIRLDGPLAQRLSDLGAGNGVGNHFVARGGPAPFSLTPHSTSHSDGPDRPE